MSFYESMYIAIPVSMLMAMLEKLEKAMVGAGLSPGEFLMVLGITLALYFALSQLPRLSGYPPHAKRGGGDHLRGVEVIMDRTRRSLY